MASLRVSATERLRFRLDWADSDGRIWEATLMIPRARYDGLRMLRLFQLRRRHGQTRVLKIEQISY